MFNLRGKLSYSGSSAEDITHCIFFLFKNQSYETIWPALVIFFIPMSAVK